MTGLKPYHRYSFAGGYHATQENVSASDNTWSMRLADLKQDTSYLHVRLYQESPWSVVTCYRFGTGPLSEM